MKGGIIMPYIIKAQTLALIPHGKKTKVLEYHCEKIIDETIQKIIDHNCCLNGSDLEGRRKGSTYLIGASYKPPIILDEVAKIILIPTHSYRNPLCIWLVLENILKYTYKSNTEVTIIFKNNQKLDLNITYAKFDRQLLRATRLESAIRGRNSKKYL